jgi:Zn-finger nucleic acid-binding protein
MKCPACKEVNLVMSERQGVEIDYCPDCRGVWLDRGELDKIIEKSQNNIERTQKNDDYRKDDHYENKKHKGDQNHYKKKGGWLSELFD